MIKVYTQSEKGQAWLSKYQGSCPQFVCVLGFTQTALIEGISAAGKTPEDRRYTAIADAEFLIKGHQTAYHYPLPPLIEGVSPVYITRAILEDLNIPIHLFNAGLPLAPVVPYIDLKGYPANCVSTGKALPLTLVKQLFKKGLVWGEKLSKNNHNSYLILSECVVGGTTTALAILTGLGIDAMGKVNSSHPHCNHQQKELIVKQGLINAKLNPKQDLIDPFFLVASVGDPMQIVVSGMAISASLNSGVLLAGGTQMLAIYGLIKRILQVENLKVNLDNIVIGTTRWVAEDPTGDTIGLAHLLEDVVLMATQLNFTNSSYQTLRMYEKGFVKEGVGAGGSAIAASLFKQWTNEQILTAIERLIQFQT